MCSRAEMAALEKEAATILEDDDLSISEKREKLEGLRRHYRECVRRHGALLLEYGRRARGRSVVEGQGILAELLASPEFMAFTMTGFAAILAISYSGALSGGFPGFPLIPLPARDRAPRPRFGR